MKTAIQYFYFHTLDTMLFLTVSLVLLTPPAQAQVLVYQSNINNSSFNRFDASTNSWSSLGGLSSTRNNTQFATDILGNIFTYDDGPRRVYRYDADSNSWADAGLPTVGIFNGSGYNLKVTNSGRFLLTNYNSSTLRYSDGGSWGGVNMGFAPNLTADYDPTTDRYVVGLRNQKRFAEFDVNTFARTFSSYAGNSNEFRRMGSIVDGYLVENTSTQGIRRWNMNNIAGGSSVLPQPSGSDWLSSGVDRNSGTLYVNEYSGGRFGTVNVQTGAYSSLPNSPTASLSSLTVVNTDVQLDGITTASRYDLTINSLRIGGTNSGELSIVGSTALTSNGSVTIESNGQLTVLPGSTLDAGAFYNEGIATINGVVTGPLYIQAGGRVEGSGSTGQLTISSGGTLAPGNSPGTIAAGNTTFGEGGIFQLEVNDFTGMTGSDPGWDLLTVAGILDLTATISDPFIIDLDSLTLADAIGNAENFNDASNYSLTFVTTIAGITGFSEELFLIDTSDFTNAYSGTFAITQIGNDLALQYTAIPEPNTLLLSALASFGLLARRRKV